LRVGVYVGSRSATGWLLIVPQFALGLAGCLLATYLIGLAVHIAAVAPFPYPIHYEDGPLLNGALALLSGRNLYPDNSAPPYLSSVYPPLHYLPFAGLIALFGPNLVPLRLLCLASTLTLTLLIHHWVRWSTGKPVAGLVAASTLLTFFPVANWAAAARADTLAVLFSLTGAYLVDRYSRGHVLWLAIPLFVLAFFTKQNQLAAAAATVLYLLTVAPWRALRFGTAYAVGIAVPFLLVDLLTGHGLYRHLIEYNAAQPHWLWRGRQMLKTYLLSYSGYLLIAIGGAASFLMQRRAPFLGIYLATSLLFTATVVSDGADFNHYIETAAVTSLLVGITLGNCLSSRLPWLKLVVASLLVVQVGLRVPSVLPDLYAPWAYVLDVSGRGAGTAEPPLWLGTPNPTVRESGARLVDTLRATRGPVMMELAGFAALAGHPMELDDPYIFASLSRAKMWQQQSLLERISAGEFSILVLLVDVRPAGFRHTRLTDEMVQAIREAYRLEETLEYPALEGPTFYIYRPVAGHTQPIAGMWRN